MNGNRAQTNKIDTQKTIHFTTDRIATPPFITINLPPIQRKDISANKVLRGCYRISGTYN